MDAIWLDHNLLRQREWYAMSADAQSMLIELWMESRGARNDGVFETMRVSKVCNHFSVPAMEELIANGWMHKDGTGCGSDWCPKGTDGHVVMHNVAGRQETRGAITERQKNGLQAKREAALKTNHQRHHLDKGKWSEECRLCTEQRPKKRAGSDRGSDRSDGGSDPRDGPDSG